MQHYTRVRIYSLSIKKSTERLWKMEHKEREKEISNNKWKQNDQTKCEISVLLPRPWLLLIARVSVCESAGNNRPPHWLHYIISTKLPLDSIEYLRAARKIVRMKETTMCGSAVQCVHFQQISRKNLICETLKLHFSYSYMPFYGPAVDWVFSDWLSFSLSFLFISKLETRFPLSLSFPFISKLEDPFSIN